MKVLFVSDNEPLTLSAVEILGGGKNGCTELHCCPMLDAPERAAQYRPDAVAIEIGKDAGTAFATIHEVHETEPVRVLAIGPSDDAQVILRTLNEGAFKYLDKDRLEEQLPTALRRLRAEPALKVKHGKVISVLGASGGCGASTIAANLAVAFCRGERGAVLVDLNFEGGDLAALLRLQPTHSLADFCQNAARMDGQMFETCLISMKSGVALLPPPQRYQDIQRITPRGVRMAITMAKIRFPYVVVDVDRTYRWEHAQALFQSDKIVLVVRLDYPSIRQGGRVLAYLDDLGIERERLRLVVNRVGGYGELRERDVEAALKLPVTMSVPDGARHLSRAVQRGIPLVLDHPRSPVAQMLTKLSASLNGKVSL